MKKNKSKINEEERELRNNPINEFTCCSKTFTLAEFKEHLSTDHKLTPEQFKGNKKMLLHMDGDYWFSSSYEWTLETGLKFGQFVRMARDKHSYMR